LLSQQSTVRLRALPVRLVMHFDPSIEVSSVQTKYNAYKNTVHARKDKICRRGPYDANMRKYVLGSGKLQA